MTNHSNEIIHATVTEADLSGFRDALSHHDLDVDPAIHEQLCQYALVLWQWNERLNLTRHTTWDLFVGRDIRDTLRLSTHLNPDEEVLDVGSGGGVPGLLLALLRPDLEVTLTESVGKKARALGAICQALNAPVSVHNARAEHILDDLRFHSAIGRAVGPLWKFCLWFEPHWASIDRLLLIKGPKWTEERGEARHRGLLAKLNLRRIDSYPTPGADGESVILQIWPHGRELN